jgi:transposase
MLHLSKQCHYWLYNQEVDMRKGFDSLHGIIKNEMKTEVYGGDIFIFINKRHNQIKLLQWEGDGLSMYYKRLEKGTYEIPSKMDNESSLKMNAEQLQYILSGIVLKSIKKRKRYTHEGNIYNEKSLYNHT